jgi:hypothetical protein
MTQDRVLEGRFQFHRGMGINQDAKNLIGDVRSPYNLVIKER